MANKEQYSSLMTIKELTMCFVDKKINQEITVPLSIVSCRTSVALSFLLALISKNILPRKLIEKPFIWLQNERYFTLIVSLVHSLAGHR